MSKFIISLIKMDSPTDDLRTERLLNDEVTQKFSFSKFKETDGYKILYDYIIIQLIIVALWIIFLLCLIFAIVILNDNKTYPCPEQIMNTYLLNAYLKTFVVVEIGYFLYIIIESYNNYTKIKDSIDRSYEFTSNV